MELDKSNMISVLSFDSRCIKVLLDHNECKSYEYPLFYKMRHKQDDEIILNTAIDIALDSNQVRAANLIIDYIVDNQNSFAFSFLFKDNFWKLLEKGIGVSSLLDSDIFCH
jgi:Fe-S cluster assembly iron-binding protein IscA